MPKKYARSRKVSRSKGKSSRRFRRYSSSYRNLSKRISAVSRRVAGESCKFELTPRDFGSTVTTVSSGSVSGVKLTTNYSLSTITSGVPWVMPLNWVYQPIDSPTSSTVRIGYNDTSGQYFEISTNTTLEYKNPVYYKMMTGDIKPFQGTELQYRLKYLYINAIFNSMYPGRMRFVIVRDRLPTDKGATWFNANEPNRSVFNQNNINAQLNPLSNGRFVILYDRTMQITTLNPLKPFKYYRKLSNKIRNSTAVINDPTPQATGAINSSQGVPQYILSSSPNEVDDPCPIGKNALYLMIFSDGCTFNYDNSSGVTESNTFKLMSRVSYYNN